MALCEGWGGSDVRTLARKAKADVLVRKCEEMGVGVGEDWSVRDGLAELVKGGVKLEAEDVRKAWRDMVEGGGQTTGIDAGGSEHHFEQPPRQKRVRFEDGI